MKDQISKWTLIVSGLIGVLAIVVGCSLYIAPGSFIPDVDFSDSQIKYLTNMWAARQISIGLI